MIRAVLEQLRQREPLARHLVAVISIHELIVVHAIGRVALDALDGRFAAVQGDDVLDEALAVRAQRQGARRVGRVVFGAVGLAGLEALAGGLRGAAGEVDGAGVLAGGRHPDGCCGEGGFGYGSGVVDCRLGFQ